MSNKRSLKGGYSNPSKKRHIEENNENVDVSNMELLQSQQSQAVVDSRVLQIDPTLKSGKIKRILLRNFMCHSNFKVELNMNVNVLVGLNGSGKSAILTAIAIGLGSRASSTARSSSLKDLVKQGESAATIEITLTNDGYDAFEADVYNKEITVVRQISAATGTSTYKIKSESGRIISTSRKELNKLMMCLNIQVENPVLILNQDAARSFLKECDPTKLYMLFLKATQIEAIIEKLHSCLKCAASSNTQLDHLDRNIKHIEGEIVVVKEKHEKLQSVARLRSQIAAFRNEYDWRQVIKAELELATEEKGLTKIREQLTNITDFIKNKSKHDKQLKDKICDFGTEFTTLSAGVREKDQVADSCRKEFEKLKCDMSSTENINRNMKERLNVLDKNVQQLETDIAERETNPLNIDNVRKENEDKMQALSKKQENIGLIINNARRDYDQFQETLNDHVEKIEHAKKHHSNVQKQLLACGQQKRQLEGSTKDALSAYGPSMTQLIKRIEDMHKRGRFAEMPRGPLGRYIEVPDKKYRSAVENILGQTLTAFYVSCDKDRILLSQMFKDSQDFSRLTIICGAFHNKVYDVSDGMVRLNSNDGCLLIDVLKVSDPVVMNCLIDQRRIESIVLAENTETAIELTQESENVPPNLSRVVLLRPFSDYYPAPNYRSYAMKENPVRYIQTSFRDVIAGISQQQKGHEEKLLQAAETIKNLQAGLLEKQKLVDDKKRLITELMQKIRKYLQELDDLKAIEYPSANEVEFLRAEINELLKKRKAYMRKIVEGEEKLKADKENCVEKEEMLRQHRDETRSAREKMTKIQGEIEVAQNQLREMGSDIKLKANQLTDLKKREEDLNGRLYMIQESIRVLTEKTTGERVESDREDEVILRKVTTYELRIQKIESHNENIQDVKELLDIKIQQVDKMIKIRQVLDHVLKTLEGIRNSRFHYIKRLRQHMSLRCKRKFNLLMALRNYTAEIEIDHKAKTLELKVVPRDSNIQDAVSNTKSLSGGERSYSTVAFLISLWSCVDHPFYFLDEYDVFSDEHNRHMMTKLLFNEADKKRDKQYGFLTPQDFSNIQASETITIHKLNDPDRMN